MADEIPEMFTMTHAGTRQEIEGINPETETPQ